MTITLKILEKRDHERPKNSRLVPPDVLEDLSEDTTEHLVLEPGDVLKLRCDVSTRRSAAVTWYKEGVRLLATTRIKMRGAMVEITDVTYEDSGVYVCTLRGTKHPVRNFTITVAGKDVKKKIPRVWPAPSLDFIYCFRLQNERTSWRITSHLILIYQIPGLALWLASHWIKAAIVKETNEH